MVSSEGQYNGHFGLKPVLQQPVWERSRLFCGHPESFPNPESLVCGCLTNVEELELQRIHELGQELEVS